MYTAHHIISMRPEEILFDTRRDAVAYINNIKDPVLRDGYNIILLGNNKWAAWGNKPIEETSRPYKNLGPAVIWCQQHTHKYVKEKKPDGTFVNKAYWEYDCYIDDEEGRKHYPKKSDKRNAIARMVNGDEPKPEEGEEESNTLFIEDLDIDLGVYEEDIF